MLTWFYVNNLLIEVAIVGVTLQSDSEDQCTQAGSVLARKTLLSLKQMERCLPEI